MHAEQRSGLADRWVHLVHERALDEVEADEDVLHQHLRGPLRVLQALQHRELRHQVRVVELLLDPNDLLHLPLLDVPLPHEVDLLVPLGRQGSVALRKPQWNDPMQ